MFYIPRTRWTCHERSANSFGSLYQRFNFVDLINCTYSKKNLVFVYIIHFLRFTTFSTANPQSYTRLCAKIKPNKIVIFLRISEAQHRVLPKRHTKQPANYVEMWGAMNSFKHNHAVYDISTSHFVSVEVKRRIYDFIAILTRLYLHFISTIVDKVLHLNCASIKMYKLFSLFSL